MTTEKKIKENRIRIVKDDITTLEVDAFVFYASPDLQLGSGYGGAISMRGGPAIQEELKKFGTVETGAAVTTSGGELQAKYIVHAVGPRFQEADTEGKLKTATLNALRQAESKGVERLPFPPLGSGSSCAPRGAPGRRPSRWRRRTLSRAGGRGSRRTRTRRPPG